MINKCYIKKALTAREHEPVLEASKILRDTQKRNLVVINSKDMPIGFLSVVDINNRVIADDKKPNSVKISEIMTKDIISIEETESLDSAIEKMMDKNLLSCPVTRENKLIGVVDFREIVSSFQKKSWGGLSGP